MDNKLEDRIRRLIENTRYGAMSDRAMNDTMDAVQYAVEDFIITQDMLEQYPIYIADTNNITASNITTSTASAVTINDSAYYFDDYKRIKMENEILKRKLEKSLGIDIDKKSKNNNDWEVEI